MCQAMWYGRKYTRFEQEDPSVNATSVVQLLSRIQLFAAPWTAACQASLFFTVSWSLLKLMSTESVAPFSTCPQSFPASGSFPMLGFLHQVARVLELQHQSFQLIFRVDFL